MNYPNIEKLGIKIVQKPYPHIPASVLNKALKKHKLSMKKFDECFGVHTVLEIEDEKGGHEAGLYPWDCEQALNRMITGRIPTVEEWD